MKWKFRICKKFLNLTKWTLVLNTFIVNSSCNFLSSIWKQQASYNSSNNSSYNRSNSRNYRSSSLKIIQKMLWIVKSVKIGFYSLIYRSYWVVKQITAPYITPRPIPTEPAAPIPAPVHVFATSLFPRVLDIQVNEW